jgi:hypothetical protein
MDSFDALPRRGTDLGDSRFPVPPARMPGWRDRRPLKRWRYVGAYAPDLMLCIGDARIGPLRQRFWAVATPDGRLRERTSLLGAGGGRLSGSQIAIDSQDLRVRVAVEESGGAVETLSQHGSSYIWTRKCGGVPISGLIELDGAPIQFEARGIVDESAGYHARHTVWSWSAGVGTSVDGRAIAWNLVTGVHDAATNSERTLWLDGVSTQLPPVTFDRDLAWIRGQDLDLGFTAWSERTDDTNAILLKSSYRQPFGTFNGKLTADVELAAGYGVMESHDVKW